jgi:hypothetical protein
MLVDVPVGASPAGGACSVATVVMLDNGKGDRPAESSGVKVSVGWGKAQSDPLGRRANRQAVKEVLMTRLRKMMLEELQRLNYAETTRHYIRTLKILLGVLIVRLTVWALGTFVNIRPSYFRSGNCRRIRSRDIWRL